MRVQESIEVLNFLYLEESHRLSSDQHAALAVALIALRGLNEDSKENVNAVVNGLRFVKPD